MPGIIDELCNRETSSERRNEAFELLVQRYQDMAFAYAYSVMQDKHLAEDIVQESFLEVWRQIDGLQSSAAFSAWFRRIIFSKCMRDVRRNKLRTISIDTEHVDWSGEPYRHIVTDESVEELHTLINELPESERSIVILYYIGDYAQKEIADMLDLTIDSVKKRMASAKKRMRGIAGADLKTGLHGLRPSSRPSFSNQVKLLVAAGIQITPDGDRNRLSLAHDKGYAVTPKMYKVPFRATFVAMTDSTNMRFRFAEGYVILNWEIDPDDLRWCDPATGKEIGFSGNGRIPIKEWVTVDWIMEAEYSALLINGTERVRVAGEYGRLAGQIGIGAAAGSIVTVQSLLVRGEETQEGQAIKPRPVFDWDGGFVYVHYDEHENAVRWYKEVLGLLLQSPTMEDRHDPDSLAEKMSSLAFPAGGLIHLKSAKSNEPLRHFPAAGNQANTNVGYMFNSPDLHAARDYFVQLGIETGDIAIGFDGRPCFAIRCIDGSRAIIRFDEGHEGFPISGFGPWYVRVPDLQRAVSWYSDHLALQSGKIVVPEKCIEIQGNCYLVFDPSVESVIQPVGSACPYFFTKDIVEQHARLSARGVNVSDVVGTGWRAMHVYDPFGNRLNVWSY